MPEQKGKRRNRPGARRPRATRSIAATQQVAVPVERPATKPQRKRPETPYWLTGIIGAAMIFLGIFFTIVDRKGLGTTANLVLLLLYFVVGGLYLYKAYRGYQRRGHA